MSHIRSPHRDLETSRPRVARRRHIDALARDECEGAEHSADRLAKALRGILGRRVRVGKAAIPCRRAAQRVGRKSMNRRGGERRRGGNEQEHQQPVVRAAALGDRYDREARRFPLCVGIRPPTKLFTTGARASMNRPGKTPATRHSAASANIAVREKRSVSRALSAAFVRGRPRKVMPNALTKHAAASAAESASSAPTAGANIFSPKTATAGPTRWPGRSAIRRRSR